MEYLAMLALRDSLDPPIVPNGTAFKVVWVQRLIVDDDDVYQAVRRDTREQVVQFARCPLKAVTVVEFGPAVLAAKHEQYRHPFTAPMPEFLKDCTAVVAYALPPEPSTATDPRCSACGGPLASATGVCIDCGHDEMGYYDDDADDWSPAELADVRERLAAMMAEVRWPVTAPLSALGREVLG